MSRARLTLLGAVVGLLAASCSGAGPRSVGSPPSQDGSTGTTTRPAGGGPAPGASSARPTGQVSPSATAASSASLAGLPTPTELSTARQDVAGLSVARLAGQLIIGSYQGTASASAAAQVRGLHLGGVIVFDDNVPRATAQVIASLRSMSAQVQQAMKADGRDWPAIVGVDQEGGPVARVGAPATAFPAEMAVGAARDLPLAEKVAHASGEELRALGFTLVFAPDADVTVGPQDPTIGVRSPGSDPAAVARTAVAMTRGYVAAGIVPVAKHFPGHGSVTTDSHVGLPVQHATLAALMKRDLVPFRELAAAGVPAIMTAHIVLKDLDATRPSTLSKPVLTGLLRGRLGFHGLIITDALNMDAVTQRFGSGAAAVSAIQAGADLLLMPADPRAAIDAIVKAESDGTLTRARLVDSAARVVATLRHHAAPEPAADLVGSHQGVADALARESITQLSGTCGARLVGTSVTVVGGDRADRALFRSAAQRAGLATGAGTTVRLLGGAGYNAGNGSSTGPVSGSGDVVIALDTPYGLAASKASVAKLAAYGRTPATFDALVQVLLGKATAPGLLPVAVGDKPMGSGCGS